MTITPEKLRNLRGRQTRRPFFTVSLGDDGLRCETEHYKASAACRAARRIARDFTVNVMVFEVVGDGFLWHGTNGQALRSKAL